MLFNEKAENQSHLLPHSQSGEGSGGRRGDSHIRGGREVWLSEEDDSWWSPTSPTTTNQLTRSKDPLAWEMHGVSFFFFFFLHSLFCCCLYSSSKQFLSK